MTSDREQPPAGHFLLFQPHLLYPTSSGGLFCSTSSGFFVVYEGYNYKRLLIIVFFTSRVPELFTSLGGSPLDRVRALRTNLTQII